MSSHRIAFYADTHYRNDGFPEYFTPPRDLDVEAILLGGDNHCRPADLGGMIEAIRATQPESTTIVVVPGNGDYIDQELEESREASRAAVERVKNAVFLDDEVLVLPSGLRVIGSTLWSRVPAGKMAQYWSFLEGHGLKGVDDIRVGDRYLTLEDTNLFHDDAVSFIEGELRSLTPAERRETVVCTHFWPTLQWVDPNDPEHAKWSGMVGTDLDAMIREIGPRYWLCGHLHEVKKVTIGETVVCSNPRAGSAVGKVNPEFRETYIVEF